MKCPKSEEFFCFTPRSIHCEHDFDSKMPLRGHCHGVVHRPRFTLVLNYVMLSSLHIAYDQHTPF